jgi:hypothetical protein
MPDRRPPYPSFEDDDEDERLAEHMRMHNHEPAQAPPRPFGHELPRHRQSNKGLPDR